MFFVFSLNEACGIKKAKYYSTFVLCFLDKISSINLDFAHCQNFWLWCIKNANTGLGINITRRFRNNTILSAAKS